MLRSSEIVALRPFANPLMFLSKNPQNYEKTTPRFPKSMTYRLLKVLKFVNSIFITS